MTVVDHAKIIAANIIANQNGTAPQSVKVAEPIPQKPLESMETRSVAVTDSLTTLWDEARHGLQWASFDLNNNGPDPVYVIVNTWNWPEAPLPVGLSIHVDFKGRAKIQKVWLKCDAGKRANVSIFVTK